MQRTLLAALLGGIVVFAWGALSHTVLPLGQMGFTKMEGEAEVAAFLKTKAPHAGTYFLPDLDDVPKEQRPASGPAAFLVWHPEVSYSMGKQMGIEMVSNVLAALVAALLIGCGMCSSKLLCRATAVMGMGVFSWLSISASQWNWYGFSDGVFIGEGLDQAIGWFLAGLAMAVVLKPKAA